MALTVAVSLVGSGCESESRDAEEARRNRLADEASPYLQLHAENPVDWYPWGEEALAKARIEGKPIFLSVGYSTCYWCHVMEREVFANHEIAALMNAHFVSIKVDREERPDIDDVYMKATHLLTGSGGWPNSVFLTPEGKPFYAGTYFPPEDGHGRPGFPRVLRSLRDRWANDRAAVLESADEVAAQIAALVAPGASAGSEAPDREVALREALRGLREGFDPEYGGFGRRQKFPRPPALELMLFALEQGPDPAARAMLTKTLDAMALGGIYDHLAGGFHRYTVERTWSIPHFEKMLYDNAQLVGLYARAWVLTRQPLYRRVVEETVAYLEREMSHPAGGFYSAQDSQVAGTEGASYVWSRDEIDAALGVERSRALLAQYRLALMHEHPAFGVLRARGAAPGSLDGLEAERAELLERRAKRPQPLRDDKVLAAWNGLAIRGLVQAGVALERPAYVTRAERAARFVLAHLQRPDGSLQRSYIGGEAREEGVLDDYAFLADGLLALHAATGEEVWRERATELADQMLEQFEDPDAGGFFLTPVGSKLLARPKPFGDNVTPSGNAVGWRVLAALGATAEGARYREAAARTERAAAALLLRTPDAVPASVVALGSDTGFRMPRSDDYVQVGVEALASDPSRLRVKLDVAKGWHVNANPASLPFLIPTSVEVPGAAAEIRYPPGRPFRPSFAEDAIEVYEGQLEIPVQLAAEADPPGRIEVRFQACDLERCLPPSRSELRLDR